MTPELLPAPAPAPAATPALPAVDRLRFSTAGSVDDGKSTLIGRLLYDSHAILDDQLHALHAASHRRGEALNLSLLTDGLRAEREQNITIDVAYRYFATSRRRFIIADTPGHAQYTRNMVTGASNADLALILIDARRGVVTQTRRHACIASLLGIPHFLIAINKMDLVDFSQSVFAEIAAEFTAFARKLAVRDVVFIPVSALHGDNVVARSRRMPWYEGPTLLHHLESVNIAADSNLLDFRFPVQMVIRTRQDHGGDYRGLAGRVASGAIRAGEDVVILPAGVSTRIRSVESAGKPVAEAAAGEAAALTLEDACDAGRGDLIARRHNLPLVGTELDTMLCWMAETPLRPDVAYILRQTTRTTSARLERVDYRLEVETLHRQQASCLELNDIGRVRLSTAQPLCFDAFSRNRTTGSFILMDPFTNATVAAGMIRGEGREWATAAPALPAPAPKPSVDAVGAPWNIPREERERRQGHRAGVLWFTGLPGSGKSTLTRAFERRLFDAGCCTMLLDGDQFRLGLSAGLGFSPADRAENLRRAGEAAKLFFEQGCLVLCAFVSPFCRDRERVRALIGADRFLEVFLDCPPEECRRRDPKGLYAAARAGEISDLTGVGQPYEPPQAPEWVANTAQQSVEEIAAGLFALLRSRGWLPPSP